MSDSSLTLQVSSPFKKEIISVSWVSVTGTTGSFLVGPGHRPLVSALDPESVVVYKSDGGEKSIEVGANGGLVHVLKDAVILFLS